MTDAEVQAKVDAAREQVTQQCIEAVAFEQWPGAAVGSAERAIGKLFDAYARVCGLQEARRQLLRAECRYMNERTFKVTCRYPHPANHDERVCQRCGQIADDERELEGL